MTTTTASRSAATLIASASNAAGATTRGTLDMRGKIGALITLKINNGATGPTAQAVCNILVSHAMGTTPAAASAGADWKTYWSFGGGAINSAMTEQTVWLEGVQHVEVEFTGNAGQGVVVEAYATVTDSYVSV